MIFGSKLPVLKIAHILIFDLKFLFLTKIRIFRTQVSYCVEIVLFGSKLSYLDKKYPNFCQNCHIWLLISIFGPKFSFPIFLPIIVIFAIKFVYFWLKMFIFLKNKLKINLDKILHIIKKI